MTRISEQFRIRPDWRRMRAEVVAHNLLFCLEPWLDRFQRLADWADRESEEKRGSPNVRREVFEEMFKALYASGIEVITDADRAAAGLEWRDASGLTETEIRIFDDRMTAAMLSPAAPILHPNGR